MSTDKNGTEGQDYYHGEFVATLVDAGQDTERVVVERADPVVLATNELVDWWRGGENPRVQLDGDVVTFGTVGEGCGRVSYKIGGRHDQWTRVLVRVQS